MTRWIAICFALISANSIVAQSPTVKKKDSVKKKTVVQASTTILVSVDELRLKLDQNNVRIIDVRSQDDYAESHIVGAARVDVGDWKNLAVSDGGLQDTSGWSKKVGSLGISEETQVVVYGGKISDAARIWWLLKYVGVKQVAILDGGWEWWSKKGMPVAKDVPRPLASKFKPEFQRDRLAEIDSVKESLNTNGTKMVDTRSDAEFANGRIPNSVQLEWKNLVNEDGRFKSRKQLDEIFRLNGILPTDTAVCY